jgi:hypothetical protein
MGCYLWKFKEFFIFPLNLGGDARYEPKNNSLVIHRLITVRGSVRRISVWAHQGGALSAQGLGKLSKGGCRTFWSTFRPEGALGS